MLRHGAVGSRGVDILQVLGQALDVGEPLLLTRPQVLGTVDVAIVLAFQLAVLAFAISSFAIRNISDKENDERLMT